MYDGLGTGVWSNWYLADLSRREISVRVRGPQSPGLWKTALLRGMLTSGQVGESQPQEGRDYSWPFCFKIDNVTLKPKPEEIELIPADEFEEEVSVLFQVPAAEVRDAEAKRKAEKFQPGPTREERGLPP